MPRSPFRHVVPFALIRQIRVSVAHYENFPVASRLVPGALARRPSSRSTVRPRGRRLRRRRRCPPRAAAGSARRASTSALDAIEAGAPPDAAAVPGARRRDPRPRPADRRRSATCSSAFAQDVLTRRYATYDDLLDYCRRSANPVGRLCSRCTARAAPDERSATATPSARDCSSSTSGRTSPSTGARTASTCRRKTSIASASTDAQIGEGRVRRALARAARVRSRARARCSGRAGRSRAALPWRLGLELSAVIAGGRASSIASTRWAATCSAAAGAAHAGDWCAVAVPGARSRRGAA